MKKRKKSICIEPFINALVINSSELSLLKTIALIVTHLAISARPARLARLVRQNGGRIVFLFSGVKKIKLDDFIRKKSK